MILISRSACSYSLAKRVNQSGYIYGYWPSVDDYDTYESKFLQISQPPTDALPFHPLPGS